MRKEIADYVFPVIRTAIEYKEGLRTNEAIWKLRFGECQKKLLALLLAPVPDSLRADVLGDPRSVDSGALNTRLGFLGIRYALACWLDEIFIFDSPWRDQWNGSSMEPTLYRSRERNTEFWEQAQRSQTRPTRDALEVYYLCVMLGFRGKMIEKPVDLAAWRETIQAQLTQAEDREYMAPQGLVVPPTVDKKLVGVRLMQKWLKIRTIVGAIVLAVVAAVAVIAVDKWFIPRRGIQVEKQKSP